LSVRWFVGLSVFLSVITTCMTAPIHHTYCMSLRGNPEKPMGRATLQ
jgi:hypothetical protein